MHQEVAAQLPRKRADEDAAQTAVASTHLAEDPLHHGGRIRHGVAVDHSTTQTTMMSILAWGGVAVVPLTPVADVDAAVREACRPSYEQARLWADCSTRIGRF